MSCITRMALLTALMALLVILPAQAHMGLWSPAMYGFDDGVASWPLSGRSFDDWWFHGNRGSSPSESMSITPGQTLTVEIACRKGSTTWGENPSDDACPVDSGAYHAGGRTDNQSGWAGNNEEQLMGCALAIAYKSDVWSVNPEDFIVMSIQERCVRQRDTPFEIPAGLPACPEGGCTCAWFWQGRNSDPEMYMTGFKCDVQGGSNATPPRPQEPRRNAVNGPTQPMYWANDISNIGYDGTQWEDRPSYNSKWGWSDGAQNSAFDGSGGIGGGGNNDDSGVTVTASQGSQETATSSSRSRTRTRTRSNAAQPTDFQHLGADPIISRPPENESNINGTAGDTDSSAGGCKRRTKGSQKEKRGKQVHRHRRAVHGKALKV